MVGGERRSVAMRRYVAWTVLACGLIARTTQAATFTVCTVVDEVDAAPGDGACATIGGECTLRAAIQESNALPGADIVLVPPGVYSLTIAGGGEDLSATGDLDVLEDVAVRGAGARDTIIDGVGLDRCLHVRSGTSEMDGLTLRNGAGTWPDGDGGGVLAAGGSLTLRNSTLLQNAADPGGGGLCVLAGASVRIEGCQVAGNRAAWGGGVSVASGSALTVEHTTISENRAFYPDDSGDGGGLLIGPGSTVLLVNTTVSGNRSMSGAGIEAVGPGTVVLQNCTVTGNRAGRAHH